MTGYRYPPGYSFVSTYWRALKMVKNPIEGIEESVVKFGPSYTVFAGLRRRMILTEDPDFIDYVVRRNNKNYFKSDMVSKTLGQFVGNGLLTSNGPYWLQQRRLIQPGFHIQKIQGLYDIMKKTVDEFLVTFPRGQRVDIFPHLNRLALEIVIHTLFDIEMPAGSMQQLSRFISETQEFVIRDIRQPHKRWWYRVSGEVERNRLKAQGARDVLRKIIRERRATDRKFNDLLDMLLAARYEDTGEPMKEEQLLDEILILVIAGHETTANALTWTLYLLSTHPEILFRVRSETAQLGVMETVSQPYLLAVINESMRLYPPAWVSDRVALGDDTFNDFKYPAGTVLVLYYFGLHRNEKYWDDPDAFNPERFMQSSSKEKSKNYFHPFGSGPRMCIGNHFAMAEMAIALREIIHRFAISSTGLSPRMNPLVTLRPVNVTIGLADE